MSQYHNLYISSQKIQICKRSAKTINIKSRTFIINFIIIQKTNQEYICGLDVFIKRKKITSVSKILQKALSRYLKNSVMGRSIIRVYQYRKLLYIRL
jgi:hypothetical protein